MHPHQSICEVAETEIFVLPDDLSPAKATLISNMETVINAIWDSELGENEKVLIAGFGNIGGLLADLDGATASEQSCDPEHPLASAISIDSGNPLADWQVAENGGFDAIADWECRVIYPTEEIVDGTESPLVSVLSCESLSFARRPSAGHIDFVHGGEANLIDVDGDGNVDVVEVEGNLMDFRSPSRLSLLAALVAVLAGGASLIKALIEMGKAIPT